LKPPISLQKADRYIVAIEPLGRMVTMDTPAVTRPESASAKRALSIAEFCDRYGIRRTKTYEEIKAGRLRIVKAGRRSLIKETDAEAWLAALPSRTRGE
jgi:excisionase family DNA binding protein